MEEAEAGMVVAVVLAMRREVVGGEVPCAGMSAGENGYGVLICW